MGGAVSAGESSAEALVRELQEELGVTAAEEHLHYCGTRHIHYEAVFHEKPFVDEQVSRVFALWMDKEPADFTLQEEEVTEVRWFDFDECKTAVAKGTMPNCIEMEELDMLEEYALSANI
jgi:8-oxo-dGTP pyrophosphatase MutT (NUDIX family)